MSTGMNQGHFGASQRRRLEAGAVVAAAARPKRPLGLGLTETAPSGQGAFSVEGADGSLRDSRGGGVGDAGAARAALRGGLDLTALVEERDLVQSRPVRL